MNLIRFFVRRPVFTWVTVILAALLGLYGYFNLGVALYPKVDIPVIVITTSYRGASPAEIESLVSKPLEDAVSGAGHPFGEIHFEQSRPVKTAFARGK